MKEHYLRLRDQSELFYRVWESESPKATVHINHGMAEHSLRYDEFASKLAQNGYIVYAQDHRGHGKTKDRNNAPKGYFAEEEGWSELCKDSYELDQLIMKENPDLLHFIFGHSMGSFVTRTNIALHSDKYDAAVICGTGGSQGLVGRIGKALAKMRSKKRSPNDGDTLMDSLAFGSYNKRFKDEGDMAWLSSDRKEVEKYLLDPDCGFTCSSRFYHDLIDGSFTANDPRLIERIRKDLPILFVSGDLDPVGDYSKGVKKAVELYRKAGIKDVELKLYKGGRHEILNDVMRNDVICDTLDFYGKVASEKGKGKEGK